MRCHPLLLAGALALASTRAGAAEPFAMIGVDDVEQLVRAGTARIYDANDPETYAEGHVPGATLVAHGVVDPKVLPQDKGTRLVFYCMNPR